jgi:zinc transporter 1/2/3
VKWSGVANSFAGGIFLAIALIHLLPEGTEAMNEGCGGDCGYPFSFLIGLMGYILILMIEKVVFDAHGGPGHSHGHTELRQSLLHKYEHEGDDNSEEEEEEVVKSLISARGKLASTIRSSFTVNPEDSVTSPSQANGKERSHSHAE